MMAVPVLEIVEKLSTRPPEELRAVVQGGVELERERFKGDLGAFKHRFFSHLCPSEPAVWHGYVEKEMLAEGNILLEAARGFAKSTLAVVAALHGAVCGDFKSLLITSATQASASQRLSTIKGELERNIEFRRIYGDLVGSTWNEDEIVLKNGLVVRAKGSGAQIRGDRYDRIIFDDSERDDKDVSDVRSKDQREKYHEWVTQVVFPTRVEGCRVWVLYTPLHQQSYWRKFSERMQNLSGWSYLRYPAIKDAASQWPTVFPLNRLEQIRHEIGTRAFNQEYMLVPGEDADALVRPEWIKWFGSETDAHKDVPPAHQWYRVLSIDSAISKRESADYTAIAASLRAVKGDHAGNIFFPEVRRGKWTMTEQVERFWDMYQIYKPHLIFLSEAMLEKVFKEQLLHFFRSKGIYAPPIRTFREDTDKRRKLLKVIHLIEQGHAWFHRAFCRNAVEELLAFTGYQDAHDDQVDVVANNLIAQMEVLYPEQEEEWETEEMAPPRYMSGAPSTFMRRPQRGPLIELDS